MRRPPLSRLLVPLAGAAAVLVGAARAEAQSSFGLRRAFPRAVTPFLGATGFGIRTRGDTPEVGIAGDYDYNNGVALGVQLDVPLSRRTGVIGTLALTPATRVNVDYGAGSEGSLDRTIVAGLDVGLAGRLKPGAPLFAYVGGGAAIATKRAAGDRQGTGFDLRASAGLGLDFMRLEKLGFRVMYLAHMAFPTTPDAAQWPAKSSAFDYTVVLGGRYTLGSDSGDRQ